MKQLEVKGRIVEMREERRRAKEDAKREERMMKLEMKKAKMKYTHELRMAAMGTGRMSLSASHADTSFDTHSRASGSHYSSSEHAFDGFSGNAMAGPSTGGDDNGFDYSTMDFSLSSTQDGASSGF
ncbi:hypothetical protein C8F04DRAFT_1251536 [Mycena alexandri]|uniref:Uncharacterized protein n=1 Tax=Mycena alexandri TaxID=1745969 RepID=A0AAD6TE94_9AGAR|nr:hypothetical protein C8F04DRAFT_1251536 [Mycena alexandri]